MEEYTQITLDQWMQWKEEVRQKLAETTENFVFIGYRLKQIRDSGMYDGAADVFEFAQNEYGLSKSTVSRFIAINERYSEGGNSLELREEFRGFSSSKLSEMLTLPDSEIQLITGKTTIREIRELKKFSEQDEQDANPGGENAAAGDGQERTPLEKCIIDFFREKKEMLNSIMACLEKDPPEYKGAAELMAPSGQGSHKKGIIFLFLYDWETGVKYKLMTLPEPVSMTWPELLNIVYGIYGRAEDDDAWTSFHGNQEVSVATSQQNTEKEAEAGETGKERAEAAGASDLAEPSEPEPVFDKIITTDGKGEDNRTEEEHSAVVDGAGSAGTGAGAEGTEAGAAPGAGDEEIVKPDHRLGQERRNRQEEPKELEELRKKAAARAEKLLKKLQSGPLTASDYKRLRGQVSTLGFMLDHIADIAKREGMTAED